MIYLVIIIKTLLAYLIIKLSLYILKVKYNEASLILLLITLILGLFIIDQNKSILLYLIPIIVLLIIYKILNIEKNIIINNGIINFTNLINNNYKLKDLVIDLNNHGIRRISSVKKAILSNNHLYVYKKILRR